MELRLAYKAWFAYQGICFTAAGLGFLKMEKTKLSSQERILLIVEMLVEKSVEGMSNKAIAFELKTIEANICRDLKILESHGWIEKSKASGKWRMTPKFGGFAGSIMKCFQAAKLRLTEDEARYASEMQ